EGADPPQARLCVFLVVSLCSPVESRNYFAYNITLQVDRSVGTLFSLSLQYVHLKSASKIAAEATGQEAVALWIKPNTLILNA
ncbi:MAG TPA: hypothetical protein PLQ01_01965, partial [Methanothrix sp.]|nr:hypothetical protein [Methanothrix sp.]